MTITRQSLAEYFGRLADGELVAEFQSGELTELAREAAEAEIRLRNIDISNYEANPPEPSSESQVDAASASGSEDLVLLARFNDMSSAYLLQSRLEAEGVPSIVADALAYQNLFGAVGGVRVLVPESHLARAAEIKIRIDRGDYTLDDQADVD